MKKSKIAAIILAVLCLLSTAAYKLYLQQQNAKIFTGTIEVTRVDITPKVAGYIDKINVSEGDLVARDDLLVQVEDRDYLLQLEHNEAALTAAEALLQDLLKGARSEELEQAEAQWAAAASAYKKAEHDWQRYKILYADGAVSRQQYDDAENTMTVASKQLDAADACWRLLKKGTREDQITAQQEEVKRCRALAEQSRQNVAYTSLKSPVGGVVLTKNYEPGEYAAVGSAVMTVADLSDCWVKIYLPSEMLGQVSYGQSVRVKTDAFPERVFNGRIDEISDQAEYTPRQSITPRERANMVFAVKVRVNNDERIFKPGMIADVIVDE